MKERVFAELTALAAKPENAERTVAYLESCLKQFLKKREQVMICFPNEPDSLGPLMEQAVLRCEAKPFFIGGDCRWMTLLKTAFVTKCNAIIGPPLTILGLAKLAKHMGTPLFARNVLVAGYPSADWMVDGIERGLDCRVWGCYDPGGILIGGFSCGRSRGVHLRDDVYGMLILDEGGREVPRGTPGRLILYPVEQPQLRLDTGDIGYLEESRCACGSCAPRLMGMDTGKQVDQTLSRIGEELLHWSSILDCRLAKTGYGLEMELVVFPGEKLPKLPSCAKLVVRPWDPDSDAPFSHMYVLKSRLFSDNNS